MRLREVESELRKLPVGELRRLSADPIRFSPNPAVPVGVALGGDALSTWRDPFLRMLILGRLIDEATPKEPVLGNVYLASSGHLLKIGYTSGPAVRRVAGLNRTSPVAVTLVSSFPGTVNDEHSTHLHFAEHRHRGEWFRDDPSIRDYFAKKVAS